MAEEDADAVDPDEVPDDWEPSPEDLVEMSLRSGTPPWANDLEMFADLAVDLTPRDDLHRPLEYVWHYTRPEAVLSIIESGKLWASHIANLNDSGEVQYGWEVLRRTLDRLRQHFAARPRIEDELLGDMLAIFAHNANVGGTERGDHYFLSASADNDVLNQWQHYGARGFALGISASTTLGVRAYNSYPRDGSVDFIGVDSVKPLEWRRVLYVESEQEHHAARAILDFLSTDERSGMGNHYRVGPDGESSLAWELDDYFSEHVAIYKHPAFAAEREVRLSMTTDHEWRLTAGFTKVRDGRFMQYQEVGAYIAPVSTTAEPTMADISLSGLRIGPAEDGAQQATSRSLQRMLASHRKAYYEGQPGDMNLFGEASTGIAISCSRLPYAP